ncbi:hypothetical protein B0H13DRAFT_1880630 [Mycena leptocephala]|nr:hypothetical protein B0H13DRAFT_1880630 [Mycena leptocephala]
MAKKLAPWFSGQAFILPHLQSPLVSHSQIIIHTSRTDGQVTAVSETKYGRRSLSGITPNYDVTVISHPAPVMSIFRTNERGEEDDDGWETDETDGDEGEDVEVEELVEVIETIMLWKSSVLRLAWKWWKCHLWNFNGSQILLTPVGGGCGILAGHKFYGPQWKKSLLAPGLVLGGNGGMAEKRRNGRGGRGNRHTWDELVALDTVEQTLDESVAHAEGRIEHKTSGRGSRRTDSGALSALGVNERADGDRRRAADWQFRRRIETKAKSTQTSTAIERNYMRWRKGGDDCLDVGGDKRKTWETSENEQGRDKIEEATHWVDEHYCADSALQLECRDEQD